LISHEATLLAACCLPLAQARWSGSTIDRPNVCGTAVRDREPPVCDFPKTQSDLTNVKTRLETAR
jgi:hypothetical protein